MITAYGLDDAWFQSLVAINRDGMDYVIHRGSYAGQRRKELEFFVIRVIQPDLQLVPIVPDQVPPPTSREYIESYLCYLMTGDKAPGEQYTYGERISPQIPKVITMLRETPNTNQACMEVGQPSDIDLPDPPCLRLIQAKIRHGALHFFTYWRSWDLWGGFPSNLGGLQLVKAYMASEIGVEDGDMWAASAGLHLYEYSWEWARLRIGLGEPAAPGAQS
jgi:thymidylate synthase